MGVPRIIIEVLDVIWTRGLDVEGIFRKNGNNDQVTRSAPLRFARAATHTATVRPRPLLMHRMATHSHDKSQRALQDDGTATNMVAFWELFVFAHARRDHR
jgi:hypothetical protein